MKRIIFIAAAAAIFGFGPSLAETDAAGDLVAMSEDDADVGAPAWYPLLRQVLTGGVMIACLLLPLASALRRF